MDHKHTHDDEPIADADLILHTQLGDAAAFGELWRRHYTAGISAAHALTPSLDSHELVQEAFTRIHKAIVKGGGPNGAFRAYLFTSIRNTAAAWGQSLGEPAIDDADVAPTERDASAAQAFRGLDSRSQEVLWYTEIERLAPHAAAPPLGMTADAVAALAVDARTALDDGADASSTADRLPFVVLPLVLGAGGAERYLSTLTAPQTPATLVAMPDAVVNGGALIGGNWDSTDTHGVSRGSSVGFLSGMGALVGVGSATLLIAGVVAAATVIPVLSDANPVSAEAAAAAGSASISADVGADASMHAEQPVVVEHLVLEPRTTPPTVQLPAPWRLRFSTPRANQIVVPAPAIDSAPVVAPPVVQVPAPDPVETVDPAPVEPTPVEPTPVEPTPVEPTPTPTEPAPTPPPTETPIEQTPVEQAPVEESPSAQAPSEQAPAQLAPSEQAPSEQAPSDQVSSDQALAPADSSVDSPSDSPAAAPAN